MNTCSHAAPRLDGTCYELRFQSLALPGFAFSFPCDSKGRVDLDQLSERARDNYLYARAVVGRDLALPDVQLSTPQ